MCQAGMDQVTRQILNHIFVSRRRCGRSGIMSVTQNSQTSQNAPSQGGPKRPAAGAAKPKTFTPGAKCVKCNQVLGMKAICVNGMYYHQDCFKCAGCQRPLDVRFHEHEGVGYCRECYMDKFAAKCFECKKPLEGALVVIMMDKEYHQTCPKCAKCRRALAGGQYFPVEDKPYCLECHWQMRIEANRQAKQAAPASKKGT